MWIFWKNIQGRGNRKCKGPEVGAAFEFKDQRRSALCREQSRAREEWEVLRQKDSWHLVGRTHRPWKEVWVPFKANRKLLAVFKKRVMSLNCFKRDHWSTSEKAGRVVRDGGDLGQAVGI